MVYDEYDRLARLETKMQAIEKWQDEAKQAIRDLEKTVWRAAGAVALVVVLIESALTLLKH